MTEYRMVKRSREGSEDEFGIQSFCRPYPGSTEKIWIVMELTPDPETKGALSCWFKSEAFVRDKLAEVVQVAIPWVVEVLDD